MDNEVAAFGAAAVGALAGPAVAAAPDRAAVEVEQCGHAGVDLEDDVAAATAVPAVGAAERLELLAPDGGAAVATVATAHLEQCLVSKLRHDVSSFLAQAMTRRRRTGKPVRLDVWVQLGARTSIRGRLTAGLRQDAHGPAATV